MRCFKEILMGLDTLSRFFTIFYKDDNFIVFLFALLHTKSPSEKGLFKREEQIPFRVDPLKMRGKLGSIVQSV